MASQRIILVSIGGLATPVVADLFDKWRTAGTTLEQENVDCFCEALLANTCSLPILSSCEWMDRWLMGDLIPGPDAVEGRRFETTCMSPSAAEAWANRCGNQWPEQVWLANRLREVAAHWGELVEQRIIVVVREVFDVSTTDEQVTESLGTLPAWLQPIISDHHS